MSGHTQYMHGLIQLTVNRPSQSACVRMSSVHAVLMLLLVIARLAL